MARNRTVSFYLLECRSLHVMFVPLSKQQESFQNQKFIFGQANTIVTFVSMLDI